MWEFMKEFAMKHPICTWMIVDGIVGGVVRVVQIIKGPAKQDESKNNVEVKVDEPSGDNQ